MISVGCDSDVARQAGNAALAPRPRRRPHRATRSPPTGPDGRSPGRRPGRSGRRARRRVGRRSSGRSWAVRSRRSPRALRAGSSRGLLLRRAGRLDCSRHSTPGRGREATGGPRNRRLRQHRRGRRRSRPVAACAHRTALAATSSMLAVARQPSTRAASLVSAQIAATSPDRRGAIVSGTGRPEACSTARTTSRTDDPVPVPRLITADGPPASRCSRAATCARARSETCT